MKAEAINPRHRAPAL